MKTRARGVVVLLFLFLAVLRLPALGAETEPQVISKEELKERLEGPGITVLDVRSGGDRAESSSKIPGAVREDPNEVDAWAGRYQPSQTLILYCA